MAAAVVSVAFAASVWAIGNPIGSPTVPPTSTSSGLVRSPNPIDTSSNLVITGNVARGKYFRGVVPYRATTDFGAPLGSTSMDSFLRDSAGVESFGQYTGGYQPQPYYSPSGTVAIIEPGYRNIFRPSAARIDGRANYDNTGAMPSPPQRLTGMSEWGTALPIAGPRPMSTTPQELEKTLQGEIEKYSQVKTVPTDVALKQRQKQIEQFHRELKQTSDNAVDLKQSLPSPDGTLPSLAAKKPTEEIAQQAQKQPSMQQPGKDLQYDVYEQMKWQIERLQKGFEPDFVETAKPVKETAAEGKKPEEKGPQEKISPLGKLSKDEVFVRAKTILSGYKTFASYSQDKFNQHLRAAEELLKQGKYYRAADTYTLASIYKPNDPLAYAGKSHALFAAGEYMSSALFLSWAMEIFPQYAQFKIDIEAMVGDKDKLENRIAEIKQLLEKNDAAELQFLLSYVYCQMNILEPAKKTIQAAFEKMPDSQAVIALKKAIEEHQITDVQQRIENQEPNAVR